jgi:ATPase subunit of ABC transporter with duplicated ATPase domains
MITVSGLTKSYGARVLFRDVTFQVSDGRRIALVGGNGAGKTTLLEIVLGTTEADGGEVHRPKDLTVGYQPQEITEWRDGSVLDEVLAGRPEVQELHHVAGEDCYLVKVRVADTAELGRLLREKVGVIGSVRSTRTTIVLETIKETGRLPLHATRSRA